MYKAIFLILLALSSSVTARVRTLNVQSSHLQRALQHAKQGNNGLDWCPQCVNTFQDFIEIVLNVILQVGVLNTCGDLCEIVAEKSGSSVFGFLCSIGCDILGIEEFVKLIEKADLDPIYYCETVKLCPINDNGDAKFKSFTILPPRAPIGTTIAIDFAYQSNNGTGTGEIIVSIDTVDKIPLSSAFLVEAQKPGRYAERLTVDTTPDPDCDPTQDQCEQWLAGSYNVTIMLCNGQCGSHHPHTQLYDSVKGTFQLTE